MGERPYLGGHTDYGGVGNEMKFTDIEHGDWPHPGVDKRRFAVYFSIDGLELEMLPARKRTLPAMLRLLAEQIEGDSKR